MVDMDNKEEVFMCMYDNMFDLYSCSRRINELLAKIGSNDEYVADILAVQATMDALWDLTAAIADKTK